MLYDYQPNRKAENAETFLGGFSLRLVQCGRLTEVPQAAGEHPSGGVLGSSKSALGKALYYLLEQWPLVCYLEDGGLELSNNRAERNIKSFVMGRKIFLSCNAPGGSQSSAVLYSLIETAKETCLDPHCYLLWVLERAPKLAQAADKSWAKKLISAKAPAECRAK